MCYNEEEVWKRVHLRVLRIGKRVFTCHDEEKV